MTGPAESNPPDERFTASVREYGLKKQEEGFVEGYKFAIAERECHGRTPEETIEMASTKMKAMNYVVGRARAAFRILTTLKL